MILSRINRTTVNLPLKALLFFHDLKVEKTWNFSRKFIAVRTITHELCHEFSYNHSNFIFCSVFKFHFSCCLRQSPRLFQSKFCTGNHMRVAGWTDTYGIHNSRIHWRILRSGYRKLAWVGFTPTTTKFGSDALSK